MCIGGNQAFGITHTINFKTMTTINTDYNNTELLDQELTIEDLSDFAGGLTPSGPWDVHVDPNPFKDLFRALGIEPSDPFGLK